MKVLFIFFYLLMCVLFINNSCTQYKKADYSEKSDKLRIIKIIPKNKNGGEYYPYKLVQRETKRIGLNFLDKGYDSIFIRLWYVMTPKLQVIDLKKSDGIWKAESHNMQLDLINDTIQIVNVKSNPAFPKSGWESFTTKLFSKNILNLPDDSEKKDYNLNSATDASFVIVEIATKNKYKIYSYTEPFVHLEFPEAKLMANIMNFIEQELGMKRYKKF